MGNAGKGLRRGLAVKANKLGTPAVIARQRATAYDSTTSEATPDIEEIALNGVFDEVREQPLRNLSGVRVDERVFVVPTLDANLTVMLFDPEIGDTVKIAERQLRGQVIGGETAAEEDANRQSYSIRRVDARVFDSVTVENRLYLEQS